jgi:hypothetical protein
MMISASAADTNSLPDHCAILPISQGQKLMRQCSRSSPKNVTDFWSPSPAQVIEIERLLPELLWKNGIERGLSESYRQYLGVVSNGKKLIYLNAFPGSFVKERLDWQTTAIIICDGGESCWGVEFDPAESTFSNFESNGSP